MLQYRKKLEIFVNEFCDEINMDKNAKNIVDIINYNISPKLLLYVDMNCDGMIKIYTKCDLTQLLPNTIGVNKISYTTKRIPAYMKLKHTDDFNKFIVIFGKYSNFRYIDKRLIDYYLL